MPFLITLLASFTTLIGVIPIFIKFKNIYRIINISISFAAGVMITVSILDLIPESIKMIDINFINVIFMLISINLGFIVSAFINNKIKIENSLYRVGVITILAIIAHNIPEGIATYLASSKDIKLGITLAVSIALHNIPEGIGIAIPIYYSTKSKKRAVIYTLLAGVSELIGAFIGIFINIDITYLLPFIAGIMIYIAIFDLIPTALRYKNYIYTIIGSGAGGLIMLLSILLN